MLLWLFQYASCNLLTKFNPLLVENKELYDEFIYTCEYSGIINTNDKIVVYYCFSISNQKSSLILRSFEPNTHKWGQPNIVLEVQKLIDRFIFMCDYVLKKLILVCVTEESTISAVFNEYINPDKNIVQINLSNEIDILFNMVGDVTYIYEQQKSIYFCGFNKKKNIICFFSFDYGLTLRDQNIEFILPTNTIEPNVYLCIIFINYDTIYFNLYFDPKKLFFELKCIPQNKGNYTYVCEIINKVVKDKKEVEYKYFLRNSDYQTIIFTENNKCYIGWLLNSVSINNDIIKEISDKPCSNVSAIIVGESLFATYAVASNVNEFVNYYFIIEGLKKKSSGCEFRTSGSLYVRNVFVNHTCQIRMDEVDITKTDSDEMCFNIVVPTRFILDSKCFDDVEDYNPNFSIYYLFEQEIIEENKKIFRFCFYKYIIIQSNFTKSNCMFVNTNNNKETLNVNFVIDGFYKQYVCNIEYDENCDYFIHAQNKVIIHYNKKDIAKEKLKNDGIKENVPNKDEDYDNNNNNDDNICNLSYMNNSLEPSKWIYDEKLNKNKVLFNGMYTHLNEVLSHSKTDKLIEITETTIILTTPSFIPNNRTVQIKFINKCNKNEVRNVYLRFQKNRKPKKKILGMNVSTTFDINYSYYINENIKNMRFLINNFTETNYVGMICDTIKEPQLTPPCIFNLIGPNYAIISFKTIFENKRSSFLYFTHTNNINAYSTISESRFVIFKGFDTILKQHGIEYIQIICTCKRKNKTNDDIYNTEYIIATNHVLQRIANIINIDQNTFENITYTIKPKAQKNGHVLDSLDYNFNYNKKEHNQYNYKQMEAASTYSFFNLFCLLTTVTLVITFSNC
ncbi:6-cysteine protein [Hepatocystis sp. ex Piliocolobus tephrosceles]|nr:6-cysteine protein [Hepatocystis sp. ex Piliocolobus tephrosceles]